MHADKCIILKPQSLRDKIGGLSHTLAESIYLKHEEDYYRNAIIKAKESGKLKLLVPGFETRKEHEELTEISWLHISSNKITNISFIEKYQKLRLAWLTSHFVDNYEVCGKLPCLQSLYICSKKIKNLKFLNVPIFYFIGPQP